MDIFINGDPWYDMRTVKAPLEITSHQNKTSRRQETTRCVFSVQAQLSCWTDRRCPDRAGSREPRFRIKAAPPWLAWVGPSVVLNGRPQMRMLSPAHHIPFPVRHWQSNGFTWKANRNSKTWRSGPSKRARLVKFRFPDKITEFYVDPVSFYG